MANFLPSAAYADGIRKQSSVSFGGLDMRPASGNSGAVYMQNMTSDNYPLISSRRRRVTYGIFTGGTSLYSGDNIIYAVGTNLWYGEQARMQITAGNKSIAVLGDYVIVFPDKKYYKISDSTAGTLGASWSGNVVFSDGTLYDEAATANTITTSGAAFPFSAGDAVTISGCTTFPDNNKTPIIREISDDKKTLRFYENIFDVGTEAATVTISRDIPDMDFIFTHDNRLYGCKGDRIYASYLGNPFNFNVFDGLATDSYQVDAGSAGDFTAGFSYLGYATFFKEDMIYKLYGSKPSNYELISSATLGVETGSPKSLAVAGEVLYYKSRTGFMAYTGGIPENISNVFAQNKYKNAVGGSDGIKYYVSCEDSGGNHHLFVFDPNSGVWTREDDSDALGFAYCGGSLYMLTESGLTVVGDTSAMGDVGMYESAVDWEYEFGDFTENDPNRKGIAKLQLRMTVGGSAAVYIKYDGGEWNQISSIEAAVKKSYYLPIIPRRCDYFRIKLTGTGEFTLHSLIRESYSGSEVH